jgi:ERCC4-type nuclease
MPVYVDSREHTGKNKSRVNELAELLKMKKVPVEVKYIESGDIIVGDLGIERKTVQDLVFSVTCGDRRLWEQLKVMKDTYKHTLLVIEGAINLNDRLLRGILLSITIGWTIPYVNTADIYQTATLVESMWDRCTEKNTGPPPPAVRKAKSPKEIQWCMLQTVRGIGPQTATRIMQQVHWNDLVQGKVLRIGCLSKAVEERLLSVFKP